MNTNPLKYINSLSFELRPSSLHGVGVFAIRDIKVNTDIFSVWSGATDRYKLPINKINKEVLPTISKYFPIVDGSIYVTIFNGMSFWFPWRIYLNIDSNYNISSNGICIDDIKKDDEILLKNYTTEYYSKTII